MLVDMNTLNLSGAQTIVEGGYFPAYPACETSAQPTARPNFEPAMGASALAQVRFSTQTSAARYGCAEVYVCEYTVSQAKKSIKARKAKGRLTRLG